MNAFEYDSRQHMAAAIDQELTRLTAACVVHLIRYTLHSFMCADAVSDACSALRAETKRNGGNGRDHILNGYVPRFSTSLSQIL
jgi:hypothetical protein